MKPKTFADLVAERPDIFDGMDCRPGYPNIDDDYADSITPQHLREEMRELRAKRRAKGEFRETAKQVDAAPDATE